VIRMKEERTKMKDEVFIEEKIELTRINIPMKELPSTKTFDVRVYRDRPWIMFFISRELYEELEALCKRQGLDVKKAIYSQLMSLKETLKEG